MEADLLLIRRAVKALYPKPITIHTLGEAIVHTGGVPPAPGVMTTHLQSSLGYTHHIDGTFYHWMHAPGNAVVPGDTVADRIEKIIVSETHAGVNATRIQLTEAVNAVRETGIHVTWKDIHGALLSMGWTRIGKRFIPGYGLKIVYEKTSTPATPRCPRKTREEKLRKIIDSLGKDPFFLRDLTPEIAAQKLVFKDDLIATISSLGWKRIGTSLSFTRPDAQIEGID